MSDDFEVNALSALAMVLGFALAIVASLGLVGYAATAVVLNYGFGVPIYPFS